MGQSLPLFVREAAEFAPEGEHVICRWCGTEWIMSFATAQEVAASLDRALTEWRVEQSGKVEDMAHWRDHAAMP